jgi:multisubunit Na+/H+ antiporter MnhG subunit
MVTVGVVLIVLGVVMGGATWGTTILIAVLGLVLVGVGAVMVIRARRSAPADEPETAPPAP